LEIGEVGKQFYLKHSSSQESGKSLSSGTFDKSASSGNLDSQNCGVTSPVDTVISSPQGEDVSTPIAGRQEVDLKPEDAADEVSENDEDKDREGEDEPVSDADEEQTPVVEENPGAAELEGTENAEKNDDPAKPVEGTSAPVQSEPIPIANAGQTRQSDSTSSSYKPDLDWSITFEQFLASMLTETPLVKFFEKEEDLQGAVDRFRCRRLMQRTSSVSGSFSSNSLSTSS
jgi:hypothetical protein